MKKALKIIGFGFAGLMIYAFGVASNQSHNQNRAQQEPKEKPVTIFNFAEEMHEQTMKQLKHELNDMNEIMREQNDKIIEEHQRFMNNLMKGKK